MTTRTFITAAAATVALAACAGDRTPPANEAQAADTTAAAAPAPAADEFTTPELTEMQRSTTGLYSKDLQEGTGEPLKAGQTAVVNYTGWLMDGTKFDSSRDPGREPFEVVDVGQAPVIPGWNEGLQGMKVGGRRLLVIPPGLAYSVAGMPPVIPPDATLVFNIELLQIK